MIEVGWCEAKPTFIFFNTKSQIFKPKETKNVLFPIGVPITIKVKFPNEELIASDFLIIEKKGGSLNLWIDVNNNLNFRFETNEEITNKLAEESRLNYLANFHPFNPALVYGQVKDNDGNSYKTINIGDKIWMAENLKATRYINGDKIPTNLTNDQWTTTNNGAFERINYTNSVYNWYAVADSRGLCPIGWHVATGNDWTTLYKFLGINDLEGIDGTSKKFGKIKSVTLKKWGDINFSGSENTNASGFSALPSEYKGRFGRIFGQDINLSYWWCSEGTYLRVFWGSDSDYMLDHDNFKRNGLSVRCVKD